MMCWMFYLRKKPVQCFFLFYSQHLKFTFELRNPVNSLFFFSFLCLRCLGSCVVISKVRVISIFKLPPAYSAHWGVSPHALWLNVWECWSVNVCVGGFPFLCWKRSRCLTQRGSVFTLRHTKLLDYTHRVLSVSAVFMGVIFFIYEISFSRMCSVLSTACESFYFWNTNLGDSFFLCREPRPQFVDSIQPLPWSGPREKHFSQPCLWGETADV